MLEKRWRVMRRHLPGKKGERSCKGLVKVAEICSWLNSIAPFDTAESYDNVGLLIGSPEAEVSQVLFCLDITEDVVREAVAQKVQLIISHHPLLFGGICRIDYTTVEGRVLCGLLEARLNVIAVHTNWDKAPGGVSDSLAKALELQGIRPVDDCVKVGELQKPLTASELESCVQSRLQAPLRRYGQTAEPILRVAVGPGACGDRACLAFQAGAQAFVVGEICHHELLAACGQGLVVLEAGHFATEITGMMALSQRFEEVAAKNLWQVRPLRYSKAPFWGALQGT